jgi:hypothetical protein
MGFYDVSTFRRRVQVLIFLHVNSFDYQLITDVSEQQICPSFKSLVKFFSLDR